MPTQLIDLSVFFINKKCYHLLEYQSAEILLEPCPQQTLSPQAEEEEEKWLRLQSKIEYYSK